MTDTLRAAGYVIFSLNKDQIEILLLQYDDYWGFTKGHLENEETWQEAAIRELHEETGLTLLLTSTEPIAESSYEVEKKGQTYHKQVKYFAGIVEDNKVVLSQEHHDFVWLGYRATYRKIIYPDLRVVLQRAWAWLKSDNQAAEFLARNLMKLN